MTDAIDFWFSTGSTYTYLTVSRLQKVEAETGVRFNWRPFSVRVLMREQQNTPFATKPIKMGYMWRDIERRAAMYGLKAKVPAPYPLQQFDLANRLALLGLEEGWASRTSWRAIAAGSSTARSPAWSPTSTAASRRPGRIRRASCRWPRPSGSAKSILPPPTRRAGSACSARRPSRLPASSSGATIVSTMP
jgi:DSBA-like thioredoxin domain